MIEFKFNWMDREGTPIVKDAAIKAYARQVLADYRPELLEKPGKIDGIHFLESYLKANVEVLNIYHESDEDPIAGAAVFNRGRVRVFDKEHLRSAEITVDAGTVLLDNSTMEEGKEGFALFTQLHEGGHLCLHPTAFDERLQPNAYYSQKMQMAARNAIICKRSNISGGYGYRKGRLETSEDFREHQANIFAAELAMPEKPFRELATQLISDCGLDYVKDGIVVMDTIHQYTPSYPRRCMLREISETFGVSRTAAEVQMWSRGFFMTDTEYERTQKKISIAI